MDREWCPWESVRGVVGCGSVDPGPAGLVTGVSGFATSLRVPGNGDRRGSVLWEQMFFRREPGDEGAEALTRAPPTEMAIRMLMCCRVERDGLTVMKQLAQLGSTSSVIIVDMQSRRQIAQEAFDVLWYDRSAQITLASILSAARYRIPLCGRVLNTVCENCGARPGSCAHLLKCDGAG